MTMGSMLARSTSFRRMPHAEVNGQRIYFQDTGGDGLPIVLAHGFLMDRSMFEPQIEAFAGEHRLVTWDQRGFGQTEFDSQPFTYWDSADDCLALLDHLQLDRAVIGGMSQGGFVALRAALKAPERVRALILLGTQAGIGGPGERPRVPGDARRLGDQRAAGRARRDRRRHHHRQARTRTSGGSPSGRPGRRS